MPPADYHPLVYYFADFYFDAVHCYLVCCVAYFAVHFVGYYSHCLVCFEADSDSDCLVLFVVAVVLLYCLANVVPIYCFGKVFSYYFYFFHFFQAIATKYDLPHLHILSLLPFPLLLPFF